jgi:hypothetical protein
MFKTTMMGNCHAAMVRPLEVNPLTAIWHTINSNAMLTHNISEYLKVAEIACVQVLGSVEDERTFSTLSFIKNRLRNRLTVNLETYAAMYAQHFFTMSNFPYGTTFAEWQGLKRRHGDN